MLIHKEAEVKIIPRETSLVEDLGESFAIEALSFESDSCLANEKIY